MPTYEYRRPDGSMFEVIQKFEDDALTVDPETGVPVQRVLSAPAIHFKGSGFYNTDYKTKKRARETDAAAKAGADKHDANSKEKAEKKKESSDSSSSKGSDSSSSKGSDSSSKSSSSSSTTSSSSGSSGGSSSSSD